MGERTEIVSEIRIEAPPQAVWDLIASVERYAEWVENTLAVTRFDSVIAHQGVTYDERNRVMGPWTARSKWRVLTADPPHHTVHAGTGIPLAQELRLEITLTEQATSTLYRHCLSYRPALGPVGRLVNAVVAPSLRRDVERTVVRLKALVESSAA